MKIIKRSGTEVGFNIEKIIAAVRKANKEVAESERLTELHVVHNRYAAVLVGQRSNSER